MANSSPSDNILKLRELTEKISNTTPYNEYEMVLKSLKRVVDEGKEKISDTVSTQSKIKCYETMCTIITNILNNLTI